MEIEVILTVIGALGGFESVKWLLSRRTNRLKDEAEIKTVEIENYLKREERLEQRLHERDVKVDTIYRDLRNTEVKILELTKKINKLELDNEVLNVKRCDVRGCALRQPPGEY